MKTTNIAVLAMFLLGATEAHKHHHAHPRIRQTSLLSTTAMGDDFDDLEIATFAQ